MRTPEIKHDGNWQQHIPENTPIIFIERPLKIFKLSLSEKNISYTDRLILLARAVQTLVFSIVTWDSSNHAGFLVREGDQVFRIHTAGGRPVKEIAPEHFLGGCDWLVARKEVVGEENYPQILASAEVATKSIYGCKTDVKGILLTPFARKNKLEDETHGYHPKRAQKYTCTEFVARVWKKHGFHVADPSYKLNKIFMGDLLEYAHNVNQFIILRA